MATAIANGNYKNMHLNQLLRPYVHFNNKNRNVNVTMQEGTRLSASYVNVKSVGNRGNFSLNLASRISHCDIVAFADTAWKPMVAICINSAITYIAEKSEWMLGLVR